MQCGVAVGRSDERGQCVGARSGGDEKKWMKRKWISARVLLATAVHAVDVAVWHSQQSEMSCIRFDHKYY